MKDQMLKLNVNSAARQSIPFNHTQIKTFNSSSNNEKNKFNILTNKERQFNTINTASKNTNIDCLKTKTINSIKNEHNKNINNAQIKYSKIRVNNNKYHTINNFDTQITKKVKSASLDYNTISGSSFTNNDINCNNKNNINSNTNKTNYSRFRRNSNTIIFGLEEKPLTNEINHNTYQRGYDIISNTCDNTSKNNLKITNNDTKYNKEIINRSQSRNFKNLSSQDSIVNKSSLNNKTLTNNNSTYMKTLNTIDVNNKNSNANITSSKNKDTYEIKIKLNKNLNSNTNNSNIPNNTRNNNANLNSINAKLSLNNTSYKRKSYNFNTLSSNTNIINNINNSTLPYSKNKRTPSLDINNKTANNNTITTNDKLKPNSFFFLNETIKQSQSKQKENKLNSRQKISDDVFKKIDHITKFSEKERLISKIQDQKNNILEQKTDYKRLHAEQAKIDLEKRKEKVIDTCLKSNCYDEKTKYYQMNEKLIKSSKNYHCIYDDDNKKHLNFGNKNIVVESQSNNKDLITIIGNLRKFK